MKGGEARAAFCFFKVPAKGLKKKQQTQPERQWRKQGGAVGAAASKTQAERGGCWEPQPGLVDRSETERLYEGEPDLFHAKRPLHFCSGLFSENQAG